MIGSTMTDKTEAHKLADACAADWDLVRPHLVVQMLRDQADLIAELKLERDFYKRRHDALQAAQSTMRDPERTVVCDILANGHLLQDGTGKLDATRYAQLSARQAAPDGWQPIKTAPRDGERILLSGPTGRISVGFWEKFGGSWFWPQGLAQPTHWQPLPATPGSSRTGRNDQAQMAITQNLPDR